MGKVLNFQQKNPLYCAQDLREYIGCIIEDVVSDEYDCNAKLVLRDKKMNKRDETERHSVSSLFGLF